MDFITLVTVAILLIAIVFAAMFLLRSRGVRHRAILFTPSGEAVLAEKWADVNEYLEIYAPRRRGQLILLVKTGQMPPLRLGNTFIRLGMLTAVEPGVAAAFEIRPHDVVVYKGLKLALKCEGQQCWDRLLREVQARTSASSAAVPLGNDMHIAVEVDFAEYIRDWVNIMSQLAMLMIQGMDAVSRIFTRQQRLERLLLAAARYSHAQWSPIIRAILIGGMVILAFMLVAPTVMQQIQHFAIPAPPRP